MSRWCCAGSNNTAIFRTVVGSDTLALSSVRPRHQRARRNLYRATMGLSTAIDRLAFRVAGIDLRINAKGGDLGDTWYWNRQCGLEFR